MTPAELLDAIRRSWWLVIACVLVGAASATAVTQATPEQYSSTVSLLVAVLPEKGATVFQSNSLLAERVKSFANVPTSSPVVNEVVNRLGLSKDGDGLIGRISVAIPPETTVMNISARSDDPQAAATLANTVGEVFSSRLSTLDPSGVTFGVSVIDPAKPSQVPVLPRPSLNLAIGVLLGAVVGVIAAALRRRHRGVLSSPAAVELASGSAVLAKIAAPDFASVRDALTHSSPGRDETFRRLRMALSHRRSRREAVPPGIWLVCGDRSDAGSAWVASQLAVAGVAAGGRVLAVDVAGPPEAAGDGLGLVDLLVERTPTEEVLASLPTISGVALMGWGKPDQRIADPLGSAGLGPVLTSLAARYDSVVVRSKDVASSSDAPLLGEHASEVLLMVRARAATTGGVGYAVEALDRVAGPLSGIVLTSRLGWRGRRRLFAAARRRDGLSSGSR